MYRIYDKSEAIRTVQRYLIVVGNPDISIVPSGVFDDNTRLSVIDFQERMMITETGVVDYETFSLLYNEYLTATKKAEVNNNVGGLIVFPLLPGQMNYSMIHINRLAGWLLDYYGFTHRLRDSNFYSQETSYAVDILRDIYQLESVKEIDEILFSRMQEDMASIDLFGKIQNE